MGSQLDQIDDDTVQKVLMDSSKESDAAAEGFYQRLWSYKIRFVCFLAVSLILLIAVIALAATRPHSGDIRTTKEPPISPTVSETNAAKASSTTHEKIPCVQCDDRWITYNRTCYYISHWADSWNDSQKYCTEHNSWLAIIDNKEEYDFLKNIKGDNNPWIGLSNKGDGSGWVWADRTPYSQNFSQIGQVTNLGDMGYAYLTSDGVEGTTTEDRPKKFFCKKK